MERRIFGLENEYGVTCTLRGQRRLSPDEVARYLFRRVVSAAAKTFFLAGFFAVSAAFAGVRAGRAGLGRGTGLGGR